MSLLILAGVCALLVVLFHRRAPENFRVMDEVLGKRLVVASAPRKPAADELVVVVGPTQKIVGVPVVVVPKSSKFTGQKATDVVAALQAKYGRDTVMAHSASQPSPIPGALAGKIAVMANEFGSVVDVKIPDQWRESDDLDETRALPEFAGKTLSVLRGSQSPMGHNPSRLNVHVDSMGKIDRVPWLG